MRIMPIHSGSAPRGSDSKIAVKCCMCHRVQIGKHWMPELPGRGREVVYSHGYCPACYEEAIEEVTICPVVLP